MLIDADFYVETLNYDSIGMYPIINYKKYITNDEFFRSSLYMLGKPNNIYQLVCPVRQKYGTVVKDDYSSKALYVYQIIVNKLS